MMIVLSKELFKKGFETEIKNIGLNLPCDYEDSDDYESSLKTGLINTKYAARYLGKSVSYLAQKRKKDKEITTRDSIPFIGSGKNISYPVDALKAYKYHNWDELKKLRQKYKNKED